MNAKDELKKEIAALMDSAFTAGFDADNAGVLDHFDGFALAEAAIEKHWPDAVKSTPSPKGERPFKLFDLVRLRATGEPGVISSVAEDMMSLYDPIGYPTRYYVAYKNKDNQAFLIWCTAEQIEPR